MPFLAWSVGGSFLLIGLLSTVAISQRAGIEDSRPLEVYTSYETAPGTGVIVFTVYAESNTAHLDRQALLKLVDSVNQHRYLADHGRRVEGSLHQRFLRKIRCGSECRRLSQHS